MTAQRDQTPGANAQGSSSGSLKGSNNPRLALDSSVSDRIRELEDKIEARFNSQHHALKRLRSSLKAVIRLNSTSKLENDNKQLRSELETAKGRIQLQSEEFDTLYGKLSNSQVELKKLMDEKNMLRAVILNSSGVEKASDDDIKHLFAKIRQQIQLIANSTMFDTDVDAAPLPASSPPVLVNFWSYWNMSQSFDRMFLVRSEMFRLVHLFILGQNLFGLSAWDKALNDIEMHLRELEGFLHHSQVSKEIIAEWRIATMKAIGASKVEHKYERQALHQVLSFFKCVMSSHESTQDFEKLCQDVDQLCKDAIELRLLMRQSNEEYVCHILDPGANIEGQGGLVEVHGVQSGGKEATNVVAMTIHGALLKYTGRAGEAPVVLEPAHILVTQG